MSLSFLVSFVKQLAEENIPNLSNKKMLVLTKSLKIIKRYKCDGHNLRCHGFNPITQQRYKLFGHTCKCKLFKCPECGDFVWEDEEGNDRGMCLRSYENVEEDDCSFNSHYSCPDDCYGINCSFIH